MHKISVDEVMRELMHGTMTERFGINDEQLSKLIHFEQHQLNDVERRTGLNNGWCKC
jgi:hypothetical protein